MTPVGTAFGSALRPTGLLAAMLAVSVFLAASSPGDEAGELPLVADGAPRASILYWSRRGDATEFAARELQAYVEAITGGRLEVERGAVVDPPADLTSLVVVHRDEPSTDEPPADEPPPEEPPAEEPPPEEPPPERADERALPEIDEDIVETAARRLEGVHDDGFAVTVTEAVAVLTGRQERGTVYAAYALLEELGVRFHAPRFRFYGRHAESVRPATDLALPAMDRAESPAIPLRRKAVENGWSHTPATLRALVDWMAKQRLNSLVVPYDYGGLGLVRWDAWRRELLPVLRRRGLDVEVGGHGYESFLPPSRYAEAHPEWFPAGRNVFDIRRRRAVETYVGNVVDYLAARPEVSVFHAWPPDRTRWPRSVLRRFGGASSAQAYVHGVLARAVKQRLGGRVRLSGLAYSTATEPPAAEYAYAEDDLVDFAPYNRSYAGPLHSPASAGRSPYWRDLPDRWRAAGYDGEVGVHEYYEKYSWHSLPNALPNLIAHELPYYQRQGVTAFGTYSEPANWIPYELNHLLTARLSWSGSDEGILDVEDYLDDRYGAAAAQMAGYLRLVEDAARTVFTTPAGAYRSRERVERMRDDYLRARERLLAARFLTTPWTPERFMIDRLLRNLAFAIADTEISYYRLLRMPAAADHARRRTHALLMANRFRGTALQNFQAMRRYEPGLVPADAHWAYHAYRRAFR